MKEAACAGKNLFIIRDSLLCRLHCGNEVALVVPDFDNLCSDLLTLHHDSPSPGHLGLYCMMRALAKRYWWKGMFHECRRHVRACRVC